MARLKKGSRHLKKAITRLASIKSIDDNLDLGNGLGIQQYEMAIHHLQARLQEYNTMLSLADEKLSIIKESERLIRDLSSRMLTGVASKFGNDSNEYEKAGGVKKSKRKRRKGKSAVIVSRTEVAVPPGLVASLRVSRYAQLN